MNDIHQLYVLDEFHAIGQFVDKESNLSWQMITTDNPIIDNTIYSTFSVNEIDPNCFELNGRKYFLKIGE